MAPFLTGTVSPFPLVVFISYCKHHTTFTALRCFFPSIWKTYTLFYIYSYPLTHSIKRPNNMHLSRVIAPAPLAFASTQQKAYMHVKKVTAEA